jgi:hypothetical protein
MSGSDLERKPIAHIARDHVQMNVKHFLHRGCTVSEKQIHTFTPHTRAPNGGGHR